MRTHIVIISRVLGVHSIAFEPLLIYAQEMRTYEEAEAAGRKAGLELVSSIDIAVASSVAGPW